MENIFPDFSQAFTQIIVERRLKTGRKWVRSLTASSAKGGAEFHLSKQPCDCHRLNTKFLGKLSGRKPNKKKSYKSDYASIAKLPKIHTGQVTAVKNFFSKYKSELYYLTIYLEHLDVFVV